MSFYDIRITGKDVKRFIHNLYKMHIEFLNIEFEKNSVLIKVSEEDYKKILEIKTIYEIEVVKLYGIAYFKSFLKKYQLFFLVLLFGFFLFLGFTNVIFEVEVVHNDKQIRDLLLEELANQGIQKYHFVVSFDKKEQIKDLILKKYKDKIEWLEIERQGTKYEVKVEERKKNQEQEDTTPKDIVAKKNGLIQKITSTSGEILAKKDQYVKKGDILIGGTIHNKEETVGYVRAEGEVIAETWYTVTVSLPYHYQEETKTNRTQKILAIEWFHKQIHLFGFQTYQNSQLEYLYRFQNPILPISLSLATEQEVNVIDKVYTKDNAMIEASSIARNRLKEKLGDNIEILYEKNLKITEEDSKIEVVIFYKVSENITEYQDIIVEEVPKEEEKETR